MLAVLAASCLAACVKDSYDADPDTPSTREAGYLIYQIKTSSDGTRADGDSFDDGELNEYALAPGSYHFALFYERNRNNNLPVLQITLTNMRVGPGDEDRKTTESLVAVFPLDAEDEVAARTFLSDKECLVLLNTNLTADELANLTLSQLKARTVGSGLLRAGNTDYFTMSNSAYAENGSVRLASEIYPDKIYHTEAEAYEAATRGEATVIAYVERVAAKFVPSFSYENSGFPNLQHGSDYTRIHLFTSLSGAPRYDTQSETRDWHAELVGYGLNGLEKETYLYKRISDNTTYFADWTAPYYRRSFWAEDLHYAVNDNTKQGYPHQYRTALETTDTLRDYHRPKVGFDNGFTTDNDKYYLKYVSWNELGRPQAELQNPRTLYSLENTYDDRSSKLYKYGYFSAGTHLLVACRLVIDGVPAGTDLYRDQNEIFYANAEQLLQTKLTLLNEKALPGGNSGINILHTNWLGHEKINAYLTSISWPVDSRLYVRHSGSNSDVLAAWSDFTLIPAEMTGSDGMVLIAPRLTTDRFFINSDSASQEIEANELISLFHKLMGAIDHYRAGAMYYPAPIGHNAATNADASSTQLGSVGVVRNHEYRVNVNSVSQPGRPVDLHDQPIIPMLDTKRDYIDVSIRILDWHNITQDNIPRYP